MPLLKRTDLQETWRRQAEGVPTALTGRTSKRKRMQDRLSARPQELEKEREKLL